MIGIFTSILVPISGESNSWCALDQAIRFGRSKSSRLYGLHVMSSDDPAANERAQLVKTVFEDRCRVDEISGELAIERGKVARRICDRAVWSDLIIMHLEHPPGSQPSAKTQIRISDDFASVFRPFWRCPGTTTKMEHALLAYDGSLKADEALFISADLAGHWV